MPKPKSLSHLHPTDVSQEPPDRGRSVAYFAQSIGVCRSMANNIVLRGEIESYKIGRRRVVTDSAIARFLASRRVDSPR